MTGHILYKRKEIIGDCTLYLGDCRDVLPTLGKVDAVVTDPPYPDWLAEKYNYKPDGIDFLNKINCRQIVFWSTKEDFPLGYSARHVWDKKTGCGSEYEFAYERNGQRNFKMFRHYLINSDVAASFTGDVWTGHKSQKPIALMIDMVAHVSAKIILDPFMGSGTTGVACVKLGRKFIGIELDESYFNIACERIRKAYAQPDMFISSPTPKATQETML
jgi:site-specific DNA-methyltransferase (adenine-specific)